MATLEEIKAVGGYVPPNPTIPAATLSSGVQPFNIPQPKSDTTPFDTISSGAVNSILSDFTNIQNQQKNLENKQNTSANTQIDLMGLLSGKTADTQTANESTGVNVENQNLLNYVQQLATLNAQAQSLNREAQAAPILNTEENAQAGRVTTTGVAQGQTEARLRQNALKALSLGQQSDILWAATTGSMLRLQAAKDKAQQIVDLKYKPIEDALAREKELYKLNEDSLKRIDSKRAEALNLAIKKDEQRIADEKEREKEVRKLIVDASPFAPADIISKAQALADSGADAKKVAISLGQYGGDYLKNLTYRSQLETDKAERANIYSQIAERNKKAIEEQKLANFQAPPIVNATTGEVDPKSVVTSIVKATGGKLKGGQSALDVLTSVQSFAKRNNDGTFPGLGLGSGLKLDRFRSPREMANRQDVEAINLKVQQWASGAALTEAQTKQVAKFTPTDSDSDNAVKTKTNGLVNFMLQQVASDLAGQGINYNPEPVDMFSGISSVSNDSLLNSIPTVNMDTTKLFNNKDFFNR